MKLLKNSPKLFVLSFFSTVFFVFASVILFNVVVDPFWYFNLVNIKGFNLIKPQATHQVRLVKAHQVCRQQPTNIIIGSSRVEIAFDPDYLGWRKFPGKVYNLGMAGLGIGELYKTMEHSYYASKNLKLAVVALDFFMFNAHREVVVYKTEVMDYDDNRLLHSSQDSSLRTFFHDISFFLGSKATLASWRTIHDQHITDASKWDFYLFNGLRDPIKNVLKVVADANGHRFIFSGQERAYVDKIWRAGPERRYCFSFKEHNTLEVFRKMIAFAYEKDLDLRFLIGPEHARMLLAIKEAGLWVQFEDWKREMVRVLDEEAKRYGKKPFPLWDFSGFNAVTTEPIPIEEDKTTQMAWYWEGSHYKKQTADAMLDKVLQCRTEMDSMLKDFGMQLDDKNVEQHLTNMRTSMTFYENSFPAEATFIKTVVNEVLKDSSGSNCGHDSEQLIIGQNALQNGDREAAKVAFVRAKKTHETEKKRAEKIGVPFREEKFFANLKASESGQKIEQTPIDWIAFQERGKKKSAEGNLEGAISDYSEAIKKGPQNAALHFLRGTTYVALNSHKRAIEDFKAGLKLDPNNVSLTILLHQSEQAVNEKSKQKKDNQVTSSTNWTVYQTSANEKKAKGNLAGAIHDYSEAIKCGPANTALHFLRGTTFVEMNDHKHAIEDFKIGLKLEPSNASLKMLLQRSEQAINEKSKETQKTQEKQAILSTEDWTIYQTSANEKKAKGDLAGAIVDYTKAIEKSPPNTALFYLRGIAYSELDNQKEAIKDFKTVLKLEPNNETVKFLLQQFEN